MKTISFILSAFLLLALAQCQTACSPEYSLTIKNKKIKVEIADTPELRAIGLMHRDHLPDDYGMLFVFSNEDIRHFWMKNTSIPLSIAFLGASGRIVDIKDLNPFSETDVASSAPARFALEVKRGWFKQNNINIGDMATFSPDIKEKHLLNN